MWLLIPSTDRDAARRVVSRIDQILGYPRTHTEAEVTRHGRPPPGGWPSVRTETQVEVLRHQVGVGPVVLHGAIAILVDEVVDALRDRRVDDTGTTMKRRIRDIISSRGWETRERLPGDPAHWRSVVPRDGGTGSADGRPIPEGEE